MASRSGDGRAVLGDITNAIPQRPLSPSKDPNYGSGKSGNDMDEERKKAVAYEYLCHLEEAKNWISVCIKRPLPASTELEDNLRNGVTLAELAAFFAPNVVQKRKIFDLDQAKFDTNGLHFRHTDNINYFLKAAKSIGLPEDFQPETTDIYDKKNMPRVIFGIHALAHLLCKLRLAPPIQDLYGKVTFTAEEISNMQLALDQYGLAMPSFKKIGGILAEELPYDEAAVHAAIIAINDALEHQGADSYLTTLAALQNPSAGLLNLDPELGQKYHIVLADAKKNKGKVIDTTVDDAYDQMLTRDEIQTHLDKVNLLVNIEAIEHCVATGDRHTLFLRLQSMRLQVTSSKTERYFSELRRVMDDVEFLRFADLENAVTSVNHQPTPAKVPSRDELVKRVNRCLNDSDVSGLVAALQSFDKECEVEVLPFAGSLYFSELNYIRQESGIDLRADGISKVCQFLKPVAHINQAVETGDPIALIYHCQQASIEDVSVDLKDKYLGALREAVASKSGEFCQMLNHADVQECVDIVNSDVVNGANMELIDAIQAVNRAVNSLDPATLFKAMMSPVLRLEDKLESKEEGMKQEDAVHYLQLLRDIQRNRSNLEGQEAELWHEDLIEAAEVGRRHVMEVKTASFALAVLNMSLLQRNFEHAFETLQRTEDLNLQVDKIEPRKREEYCRAMLDALASKSSMKSDWVKHRLTEGDTVYLDLKNHRHVWSKPRQFLGDNHSAFLSVHEIELCVEEVHNAQLHVKAFEKAHAVRLQALCRGYLVRQKLFGMLQHYYERESQVVKVQSLWRGRQARRCYRKLLSSHKEREAQSNRHLANLLVRHRLHVDKIVLIQRAWRDYKSRMDFRSVLMQSESVSVAQVRKYLHLVDLNREDFDQELELQNLKGQITKMIRANQALEKDLDTMDIKIGLLVSNQIDVQEVLAHDRSLLKKMRKVSSSDTLSRRDMSAPAATGGPGVTTGLKALKKESRQKLDAYQHLFYLLQTNPEYLAKLIFVMPQSNTTRFMESVILTLYNYGANAREEFLLLNLFRTALEEEVTSKVERPNDILTGNPLVVCMIVRFYRSTGKAALREMLTPLINNILEQKDLHININPVEVYKQWINSMEYNSGQVAGMPYDVTAEAALKYEEVQKRLQKSITKLKQVTTMFLATIVKSGKKLPYGIQYMAKVLRGALQRKFPSTSDKDLLKIVGNLIYYRYINSAIAAPDAFELVANSVSLNNDQRRNLGSIAKILQAAAMKKGFGDEAPHLVELNSYIVASHDKFKQFFMECCRVPEPEDHFMMNRYTEISLIAKPVVYITLQEICDTHSLLLRHRHQLADSENDKLNELLDDLGEEPSLCSLLGAVQAGPGQDKSLGHLAQTEVCLTLTNKFALSTVDHSDMDRLFVKTKQLIAAALPCTSCNSQKATLIGCLKSITTRDQMEMYWDIMARKEDSEKRAATNHSMLEHTNLFADDEAKLSLEDCKRQILKNLQILERHGQVSSKDGCNAIVVSLARDICNRKEHRTRRRREIFQLKKTIRQLERKSEYHSEQVDYYHKYLKTCLANLQKNKGTTSSNKKQGGSRRGQSSGSDGRQMNKRSSHVALKYSAAKLHEKGILLSIDGLPSNQFKNIQFEIVPVIAPAPGSSSSPDQHHEQQTAATSTEGMFQIHAKFMGVRLEHVDIDIQDLLQLQYEGVSVMNVFGKAKINVNLLLYLLNTKFYTRKRR